MSKQKPTEQQATNYKIWKCVEENPNASFAELAQLLNMTEEELLRRSEPLLKLAASFEAAQAT